MPAASCALIASFALALLAGCTGPTPTANTSPAAATTQPATQPTTLPANDPRTAEDWYWYSQPAVETVESPDFAPLWRACREAAVKAGFTIDRQDYRTGLLTTRPLISKQVFEPWKSDVVTAHDLIQSTLATIRRTVHFQVTKRPDGGYEVAPKVVVERYEFAEHRITSVVQYRDVFRLTREEAFRRRDLQTNPGQATVIPPPDYWHSIGRDPALEQRLAGWIRDGLKSPPPADDETEAVGS
jgi:hypothetical protein